jgi:hypothetical protein
MMCLPKDQDRDTCDEACRPSLSKQVSKAMLPKLAERGHVLKHVHRNTGGQQLHNSKSTRAWAMQLQEMFA